MQTPLFFMIPLPPPGPTQVLNLHSWHCQPWDEKAENSQCKHLYFLNLQVHKDLYEYFPPGHTSLHKKANAQCKSRNSFEHFQQLPFKCPQKEQSKTLCEGEAPPRQTSHFKVAAKYKPILWITTTWIFNEFTLLTDTSWFITREYIHGTSAADSSAHLMRQGF